MSLSKRAQQCRDYRAIHVDSLYPDGGKSSHRVIQLCGGIFYRANSISKTIPDRYREFFFFGGGGGEGCCVYGLCLRYSFQIILLFVYFCFWFFFTLVEGGGSNRFLLLHCGFKKNPKQNKGIFGSNKNDTCISQKLNYH